MAAGNPDLYRHLALYLQVLREVLPVAVDQAVYQLATQFQAPQYLSLLPARRRELHRRLVLLVGRCTSLLTVEQLVSLARRLEREQQRHQDRELEQLRRRLLEGAINAPEQGGVLGEPDPGPGQPSLPPGSVQLAAALPVHGLTETTDLLGWNAAGAKPAPAEQPHATDGSMLASSLMLDALRQALPSPWQPGRLPEDPEQLLLWIEAVERALRRRLRNLSHAINVELLRIGLVRQLLPVALLDAVIAGDLETQSAPPNLLRLQLPLTMAEGAPALEALALLLRPLDLELEDPRLRTCRRRILQHGQQVRRMADHHRRLQRRLQLREAEQLWRQDIRSRPQNPPPSF